MTDQKCGLICGLPKRHLVPRNLVGTAIVQLIQTKHPEWNDQSFNCLDDLLEIQQIQTEFIQQLASREDPADRTPEATSRYRLPCENNASPRWAGFLMR